MHVYRDEECVVVTSKDFMKTANLIVKQSQKVVQMARKLLLFAEMSTGEMLVLLILDIIENYQTSMYSLIL